MSRRLTSTSNAAMQAGVTNRTIRNWVSRGDLPGYLVTGRRGLMVDLDEMEAMLRRLPDRRGRAGVAAYGPKAKITRLPAQPEVVRRGDAS